MNKVFLFFVSLVTIAALAVSGQVAVGKRVDNRSTTKSKYFDAGQLLRDVEYLASDELEGRSADLPSMQKARDYVEKRFKESGIKPIGTSYKQEFQITDRRSDKRIPGMNFIGVIKGKKQPDKHIVITAHYDHLGLSKGEIYNGADDNASGTAGLLELAEAFAKLNPAPKRSILFLAVTAEEKGLLGAKYYAENPLYPRERTLANINMDGLNQWGRTRDVVIVGYGNSTLDDTLVEAASAQGRVVKPDAEPEKGFFYRSDHFEFAKQGVPALYTDEGTEFIGKPEGYGMQKRKEYTDRDYHKVSDDVKPDWDLSGAVEDLRLLFQIGYRVAQGEKWPEWKTGAEFKARRDEAMKRAKS